MSAFSVLHAGYQMTPAPGVIRQLEEEQRAADELGLHWKARLFCPAGTEGSVCEMPSKPNLGTPGLKRAYYQWLYEEARQHDAVVLRYTSNDPLQGWFMRRAGVPVVTVHHSLELQELTTFTDKKNRLKYWLEKMTGPWIIGQAVAIGGVTREIAESAAARSSRQDQPVIHYANGAVYGPDCVVKRQPGKKPTMLFVASRFSAWIGLDRLLDAAAGHDADFTVHLVGTIPDPLLARAQADKRFVIHGRLPFESIRTLMAQCHLGIASLGLDRNQMTEGSTLKVREYLRAGLPVFTNHRDLFEESFEYYHCTELSIDAMLDYAKVVGHVDGSQISAAAQPYIDKSALLQRFHDEIMALMKS